MHVHVFSVLSNRVDAYQTAHSGTVCSGSMLFFAPNYFFKKLEVIKVLSVLSVNRLGGYLMIFFLSVLHKNLCFGCSLESPRRTYVVGTCQISLSEVRMASVKRF